MLARTAKEIDDDVSKLTQDLGVDFYEYLTYTASVLQDVRSKLRGIPTSQDDDAGYDKQGKRLPKKGAAKRRPAEATAPSTPAAFHGGVDRRRG